jgi:hypothetical protein
MDVAEPGDELSDAVVRHGWIESCDVRSRPFDVLRIAHAIAQARPAGRAADVQA